MGLDHQPFPFDGSIGQYFRHSRLSTGVQVNLWLLNIEQLSRLCSMQGDDDRKCL